MYDHLAVCTKDVDKSYGSQKILNKICLNVKRGCIYGLLGSSGCGKTTILSCIIGQLEADKGEIYLLGEKRRGIPGAAVGYMPQTLSLIGEFTVKDTIYFFGRIYNVPEDAIKRRYTELVELLELPTDNRYIKNCSGGEQRRVSFAASMVHQPKLLILDEPTVGTDPIMRNRVWNYLIKISEEDKTSVIITTHYIEETRQANTVGLMREGKILIEEKPEKLLSMYNVDSLEEVFLILSAQQDQGSIKIDNQQYTETGNVNFGYNSSDTNLFELTDSSDKGSNTDEETGAVIKTRKKNPSFAWYRFRALMEKNWKTIFRNYGSIFPMLVSCVQVICFLIAVGRDTTDNPFGILNAERSVEFCKSFPRNQSAVLLYDTLDCHINSVSCLFEDYIDIPSIKKIRYDSTERALEDLQHGKIIGFIHIHQNISKLIENRLLEGIDKDDLPDEEIQVYIDMSAIQIGGLIKRKIADMYQKFHRGIYLNCSYLPKAVEMPLRIEETFYGSSDEEYTIFITPGIVTTMIYFMGVLMACTIIVEEKSEGIWDRSIIAGVTALELSMSHLLYQTLFMVIVVIELIIIVFFIFGQAYTGSLWLIFALIYLQGVAGIVLGFGISVLSKDHITANIIVSGIFNPLVISSGVMWPLEAIDEYLLYLIKLLPLALPTTALRNIIKKGWSLYNLDVAQGFVILCIWIIILLLFSIYIMKRKR